MRSHQCHHAGDARAERHDAMHGSAAQECQFGNEGHGCSHPCCSGHRLKHVGVWPATRDVPAQHDRKGLQEERHRKDAHSDLRGTLPSIDEAKKQKHNRSKEHQPRAAQIAVAEVPTLPFQAFCWRIDGRHERRQQRGDGLHARVDCRCITLLPRHDKAAPIGGELSLLGFVDAGHRVHWSVTHGDWQRGGVSAEQHDVTDRNPGLI